MTVETKRIKVNKDTRLEQLTEEARNNPIIFEINGSAYSLNPIGHSSSPFTVKSAYASIKTIDGRSGEDGSNEEIVEAIQRANEEHARNIFEELNNQ